MASILRCARLSLPTLLLAAGVAMLTGCGDEGAAPPKVQAPPTEAALPNPSAAAGHVATGRRLLQEGKREEAVEQFTLALDEARGELEPDRNDSIEAQAYYDRGMAYLELGFPDTAAEDFTEVINLARRDAGARKQRGRAYLELGDIYKALRDCTEAIRLDPDDAEAYRHRGEVYVRRGNYERAAADLAQALELDPALADALRPKLAEVYVRWSEKLSESGEAEEASAKLAEARTWDPNVAVERTAAKPAPDAVELTAAKPVVDAARERFEQGRARQLEAKFDEALIEFTNAIALRGDFAEAYLRRGETLLSMGFPDTALEDLKQAANYDLRSGEVFCLQAQAFTALGSHHRAMLAATQALHYDPTHADAYLLRGQAYLELEKYDRAIADLEAAMRRDARLKDRAEPLLAKAQRLREEAARRAALSTSAEAEADDVTGG